MKVTLEWGLQDQSVEGRGGKLGHLPGIWPLTTELRVGGKNRTPHLGSGHGGREEQC